ncbi:MAG TPA: Phenylacetic acid catabolic protein, partial [Egibacteraceae bacterium]|nr:Phenylacetic acid catabolic protein [Egibacteraceae bacterium]
LAADADGRDPDILALGRAPEDYRSCALVERPNGDWAYTVARHWLADTAETARLEWLAASGWPELAGAAAAPLREQAWHVRHAEEWVGRLAAAGGEAVARLRAALERALPEAPGLFAPSVGEDTLVADGTLPCASAAVLAAWRARRRADLDGWGLGELGGLLDAEPGDRTARTPEFAPLWEELTGLHRAHPGAAW